MQFGQNNTTDLTAYVYTDRPVYRPGHTVHIKASGAQEKDDALDLPEDKTLQLKVTDADGKAVLTQDVPVSAHGTVTADLTLAADAALGYYRVEFETATGVDGEGSFYVEEYKKPEYQVTVKPTAPRILQGNNIQAVIEARYFFGEPVAGAKVKYVVHTSEHYWWDEDETEGGEGDSERRRLEEESDETWGATEQQEHEGVLDANGRLTVTLPTKVAEKPHWEQQGPGLPYRGAGDRRGQPRSRRTLDSAGHVWHRSGVARCRPAMSSRRATRSR